MKDGKKYIAEFIGTCVLVLFGCGSAVIAGNPEVVERDSILGVLGIAFAFGFALIAMAYSIGTISGCHINPAVSLAMLINKRIGVKDFIFYVISQIAGAILGCAVIYMVIESGGLYPDNFGQNTIGEYGYAAAFFVEALMSYIFVLVIMTATGKKGNPALAGLIIGLTLISVHIFAIPITGTSVNPARSIAPAIFAAAAGSELAALSQLWLFVAAPLAGAALAAVTAKRLLASEE